MTILNPLEAPIIGVYRVSGHLTKEEAISLVRQSGETRPLQAGGHEHAELVGGVWWKCAEGGVRNTVIRVVQGAE